jgi:hypothetical protein
MTAKCANPACDRPFHYFRSGKIYLIDMASWGGAIRPSNGSRGSEYFWLCGDCSQNMRVTLDGCGAVKVESLSAPMPDPVARHPIVPPSKETRAVKAVSRGA